MRFDWDDANREHIAEHGVTTAETEWVRVVTAYDAPRKWRTYCLAHKVDLYGAKTRDPKV